MPSRAALALVLAAAAAVCAGCAAEEPALALGEAELAAHAPVPVLDDPLGELADRRVDGQGFVTVVVANRAFARMAVNTVQRMERLGTHNWLVVATDPCAARVVRSFGIAHVVEWGAPTSAAPGEYQSEVYLAVVDTKILAGTTLARMGFRVLVNDADYPWLESVYERIVRPFHAAHGVQTDFLFSVDEGGCNNSRESLWSEPAPAGALTSLCNLSSGSFVIWPTNMAVAVLERAMEMSRGHPLDGDERIFEQTALNRLLGRPKYRGGIREPDWPSNATVAFMNPYKMAPGILSVKHATWRGQYLRGEVRPVAVHANWIKGLEAKEDALIRAGLLPIEMAFPEREQATACE